MQERRWILTVGNIFFISKTLPKISVLVLLTALRIKGVAAQTAEKKIANISC